MGVVLNSSGEVADFVDVSQFHPSLSAFECVAYAASLCYWAGPPGHGTRGNGDDVERTANLYYSRAEGSDASSNTNGMSLQAEYTMLHGLGLHWFAVTPTVAAIRSAVEGGYAVLLCGAETGMVDMEFGHVPYSWPASGNHCIVISGIASDGNFLVRDTANIGPTGLRPDPRRYLASAMQIVSATAVTVPIATADTPTPIIQEEELPILDITNPTVARYFELATPDGNAWKCRQTGKVVQGAMLQDYRTNGLPMCGMSVKRLPRSNEIDIDKLPGVGSHYAQLANKGIKVQFYEGGAWIYDPQHLVDDPPDAGSVYPLKLYDPSNPAGQGPLVTLLKAQLATAEAPVSDPTLEAQITALQAKIASAVKALS